MKKICKTDTFYNLHYLLTEHLTFLDKHICLHYFQAIEWCKSEYFSTCRNLSK